jgi:hypothetical protein
VEEQAMAARKLMWLTALVAVAWLRTAAPAPAQQAGEAAPHQGKPSGPGMDGHQISHIYVRYYPYASRYPHAGFAPGLMATGFGDTHDYYGYLPATPPTYQRLIVIPPPPPPPLPPPLTPRR